MRVFEGRWYFELTRLKTSKTDFFKWKTIRDGVVNDMTDAFPENFVLGLKKANETKQERSKK